MTLSPPETDEVGSGERKKHGVKSEPTFSHAGAMVSALFLLIFAIAVIVPWTVADSARQNTYAEANALVEASWMAGGLPPGDAASTRAALRDYAQFVADEEWRSLRRGELDPRGWSRLDRLRAALARLPLEDRDQQEARDGVQAQLQAVYAARRQRAVDAATNLPHGVLMLTGFTGLVVMILPVAAGARPRGWVWAPYGLMALCLGVGIYLVFAINHTFSGPLGVDSSAFTSALHELGRIP
jgi:hypothetical protein